ncbi:MAG: CPBP family intramembrane metalloprotease [Eubacterium sp.]|nr:CPBP family intramembrane metalloprotease [Eubacterium sp.]
MKNSKLSFLIPIRSVIFVATFLIGSVIVGKEVDEISNWWSIVATCANIFIIALLVLVAKKNKTTYAELINYKKGETKISQVVLVTVIALVVAMSGMYLSGFVCYGVIPYGAPMMIAPIHPVLAIINFILLPLTVPFAEDGLYLGCGVSSIKNKYAAILVPAFFYALQHCFIPTIFDVRYIVYRFLSFLPLTIIFCFYYHKKKNPVPIMIAHSIVEMASVSWIAATTFVPGFYDMMLDMAR